MKTLAFAALLMTSAPLAACGDDGDGNNGDTTVADTTAGDTAATNTGGTDTTTGGDTTAAVDTTGTAGCDKEGFVAVAQDSGAAFGAFQYLAQDTLGAPVSVLKMELVEGGADTADAVGTYDITDDGYEACDNCVLIFEACDENLTNCAATYIANEGTLDITSFGDTGGQFTGTLSGVKMIQVTVGDDFTTTPVVDGKTWCLDSYSFDAEVQ